MQMVVYPRLSSKSKRLPIMPPKFCQSIRTLADPNANVLNFSVTDQPRVGDIVAFDPAGHTGILLGNGIYISARAGDRLGHSFQVDDGVQITVIPEMQTLTFRSYDSP